jgi:hypothetical protein
VGEPSVVPRWCVTDHGAGSWIVMGGSGSSSLAGRVCCAGGARDDPRARERGSVDGGRRGAEEGGDDTNRPHQCFLDLSIGVPRPIARVGLDRQAPRIGPGSGLIGGSRRGRRIARTPQPGARHRRRGLPGLCRRSVGPRELDTDRRPFGGVSAVTPAQRGRAQGDRQERQKRPDIRPGLRSQVSRPHHAPCQGSAIHRDSRIVPMTLNGEVEAEQASRVVRLLAVDRSSQ